MITERQLLAILGVVAATATLGFSLYAVYKAFNPNQTVKV
jgi:hypothetical protein